MESCGEDFLYLFLFAQHRQIRLHIEFPVPVPSFDGWQEPFKMIWSVADSYKSSVMHPENCIPVWEYDGRNSSIIFEKTLMRHIFVFTNDQNIEDCCLRISIASIHPIRMGIVMRPVDRCRSKLGYPVLQVVQLQPLQEADSSQELTKRLHLR